MRLHLIFNQNNEDDNQIFKDNWDRFLSIKTVDGQLREISD